MSTCLSAGDSEEGNAWAEAQQRLNQEEKELVFVNVSFKGNKADVRVALSDQASFLLEMASDAFGDKSLDPTLTKMVHRGKKLEREKTLESQNVKAGAKIMMISSTTAGVEQVKTSVSDPTIRGFDSERALEKARRAAFEKGADSAWQGEQDKEFKFSKIEVVAFPVTVKPHPFEAEKLLTKLATDPGIVACMREHRWTVGKLIELDPADDQKKHDGSGETTLGYNENAGFRIYVRLRTDDLRSLRPYRELVNTLIHELSHNAFGPHTEPFWRLFAQQKRRYLRAHAQLQAQGTVVKGMTASRLADLAESGEAQDISGSLRMELSRSSGNNALKPHEREAAARVVMEYEALALLEARSSGSNGGGGAGGAADGVRALSSRDAAAAAAETRLKASAAAAVEAGSDAAATAESPSRAAPVIPTPPKSTQSPPPDLPVQRAAVGVAPRESSQTMGAAPTSALSPPAPPPPPGVVVSELSAEARVRRACAALAKGLRAERQPQQGAAAEADTVVTLSTIVSNVLKSPSEGKFRKLKRSNKRLKRSVLADGHAVDLLDAIGFQAGGEVGAQTDKGDDNGDLELPADADLGLLHLAQELLGHESPPRGTK